MTNDFALSSIIGDSPAMQEARRLIETYAPSDLPIVLAGATGTGKELIARHIHRRSGRLGRWVALNCGALPREMAESLLFGHRRGAFTGAVESRRGYMLCADRGTLFLDELLELSLDLQAKLLRAIDFGEVHPLAEHAPERADVRIVAAVQESIWDRLEQGALRLDLWHRIAGVVIALPALRERREDIIKLADHYAAAQGRRLGVGADAVLLAHAWPGNVRELRLVIERAAYLASDGTITINNVQTALVLAAPPRQRVVRAPNAPRSPAEEAERERLILACRDSDWDTRRAAMSLGFARATLYRRLRTLGISLRVLRTIPPDNENSPGILTGA
jgi:transcriptional regulator with GAF, ATPase, and Fis domain